MVQDQTLELAIAAATAAHARAIDADKPARAARAGLHEDPDASWGSEEAVLAAIETVWWISAGDEHRGAQSPGTRLSAFYWVRSRGIHQIAALATITDAVPGGYAGGFRGGYGGTWEWADRQTIDNLPQSRQVENRAADYDQYLSYQDVLESLEEGIDDLKALRTG